MELLREEISSEQTAVKINAIHRIGIIATLIGSSKVKRELLPYVESKYSLLQTKNPPK